MIDLELKLKLNDGKVLELTSDEAKELYNKLHEIYGTPKTNWNPISTYTVYPIQNPIIYNSNEPYVTLCKADESGGTGYCCTGINK